eukprot:CAMPEP_0119140844 /NCGR_PEP_ID=MMETSP1310-20130426/29931_1 /TAXON_ID=464262 /ORGANISM="Genus nov. species nov., Strain RCC2339" /LENGTH=64 /DNA_ID=CAMNT_0007132235 /DNA_START=16 /DNA_END=206 /DNA_ORIENTATION=-
MEDFLATTKHKVPLVRSVAVAWFARCLRNPQRMGFGIKTSQIKPLLLQMVTSLDDQDASVRDSA